MDFWIRDFLHSTAAWTGPETAAYSLLLLLAWANGARLPVDPDEIGVLLKYRPEEWARLWRTLESKWPIVGDHRENARMIFEWEKAQGRAALGNARAEYGRGGGLATQAKRQANREARVEAEIEAKGVPRSPISDLRSFPSLLPSESPSREVIPSPQTVPSRRSGTALRGELLSSLDVLRGAILESFETFWGLYPRKDGKGAARKAWARLTNPDRRAALDAVFIFGQIWSLGAPERVGRFIPLPTTWLNQRRFEDDPVAWKRMAAGDSPAEQRRITAELKTADRNAARKTHAEWLTDFYKSVGVEPEEES